MHQYSFPLGAPFAAWIGGVSVRLGCPSPDTCEFLMGISTNDDARRLKVLARSARSWQEVITLWDKEAQE
jgi:hypothetical protein